MAAADMLRCYRLPDADAAMKSKRSTQVELTGPSSGFVVDSHRLSHAVECLSRPERDKCDEVSMRPLEQWAMDRIGLTGWTGVGEGAVSRR